MNVQTSALATPDNIPADSGFVIPDPAIEPVQTASLSDLGQDDFENVVDEPTVEPQPRAPRVSVPARVEPRNGQDAEIYPKPRIAKKSTPRAVTRAATTNFAPQQSVLEARLDYVIGVYR